MPRLLEDLPIPSTLPLRMNTIPAGSVMVASALSSLPIIVETPILPPLGFLVLICWRMLRSDLWPVWIGIPLGFWDDLLSGQPVGSAVALWTVCLLSMDALDRRVVWRNYWVDWALAALALAFVLIGGAFLARAGNFADVVRLITPQFIVSLFMVPLAMLLVSRLDAWRIRR